MKEPGSIPTRRKTASWLLWIVLLGVSFLSGLYLPTSIDLLRSDQLLNYLGVCLGLMIAIITFLHGVADKLLEKLVADYAIFRDSAPDKAKRIKAVIGDLDGLFGGLKSTTLLMFVSLLLTILVGLLDEIRLPKYVVTWTLPWSFSVQQLYASVKSGCFVYSLVAIYMVIVNLFHIIDASTMARTKLPDDRENNGSSPHGVLRG